MLDTNIAAVSIDAALPEPYVGPLALDEKHGIYGRNRELRELYNLLIVERIMLLYSPSGAGKSSLIQAGLIPRLRGQLARQVGDPPQAPTPQRSYFDVVSVARFGAQLPAKYAAVSDATNPFVFRLLVSLEQTREGETLTPAELATLTLPSYAHLRYGDQKDPSDEEPLPEQHHTRTNRSAPSRVVWIFDQFEDVLTVDPLDVKAKHEFFEQLGRVLGNRKRWVLFSMREDYLGQLEPYQDMIPGRLRATYRLSPLGPKAAAQAIIGPASVHGVSFDKGVVEHLVKNLQMALIRSPDGHTHKGLGPYVEPVQLQVACRRMWNRLPPGTKVIGLEQIGDVSQALTEYYAESVEEVARQYNVHERRVRDWVERLITPQGRRGQVPLELEEEHALPPPAVEALVDMHLVRREVRHGTIWFELAHDTMIEPVRKDNEHWRDKNLNTLQKSAPVWASTGRPAGLLLVGAELREAERQVREEGLKLIGPEPEYLEASSKAASARRRQWAFGFAVFESLLIWLGVVMFLGGVAKASEEKALAERDRADANFRLAEQQHATAVYQRDRADAEADLAVSRALAIAATSRLNDRLDLSLLLSVEAHTVTDTVEARASLYSALVKSAPLLTGTPRLESFLWGQPKRASAVAFSPDGRIVASAGEDGAIWLWDTETHELLRSLTSTISQARADERWISALAFSPDGRLLASGGWDDKVRLWNVNSWSELQPLEGHTDDVTAVAFAPSGNILVSAGREGTLRLWDPLALKELGSLPGGDGVQALTLAFSPKGNGSVVFSGGSDGLVRRWDLVTRQEITPALRGADKPVRAVTFNPQGELLASAAEDGTVLIWDVEANGKDVITTTRDLMIGNVPSGIFALAFSPDGKMLFGAGERKGIHAWDVTGRPQVGSPLMAVYTLEGHTGTIHALAAIGDPRNARPTLASAGEGSDALGAAAEQSDVRLWDLGSTWPVVSAVDGFDSYAGVVNSISVTHDGRILASGGADGSIHLWDLPATSQHGQTLFGHEAPISELAFSPVDGTLASIGTDGELLIWREPWETSHILQPAVTAQLTRPPRLAFSSDGRTLAVAYGNKINFWDVTTEQKQNRTLEAQAEISAVGFSSRDSILAAGGCLGPGLTGSGCPWGVLSLWKMADTQPFTSTLPIADTRLSALAFSEDGTTLATGYTDRTIRLWELPTLNPLGPPLQGHAATVTGLAFSLDGRILASTSGDGSARLWPTRGGGSPNAHFWRQFEAQNDLAFTPDGRLLAVAGGDAPSLRLLDVDLDSWVRRACTMANRDLTDLEWKQYLPPDRERHPTCADLLLKSR